MPLREYFFMAQNENDDETPGNRSAGRGTPADVLQSKIINAFEAAIEQGMLPVDALAAIVSWISSEMMRLHADQET